MAFWRWNKNGAFRQLAEFFIPPGAPFASGANTLDLLVANQGAGPTGLRVDGLVGGALPYPTLNVAVTEENQAVLQWPAYYVGWTLASSEDLIVWTSIPAPSIPEDGSHQVTAPIGPQGLFFRLER